MAIPFFWMLQLKFLNWDWKWIELNQNVCEPTWPKFELELHWPNFNQAQNSSYKWVGHDHRSIEHSKLYIFSLYVISVEYPRIKRYY